MNFEPLMHVVAKSMNICAQLVDTMPARGSNPHYQAGFADAKEMAVRRIRGAMVETLKDIEAQMKDPHNRSIPCQNQEPPPSQS